MSAKKWSISAYRFNQEEGSAEEYYQLIFGDVSDGTSIDEITEEELKRLHTFLSKYLNVE